MFRNAALPQAFIGQRLYETREHSFDPGGCLGKLAVAGFGEEMKLSREQQVATPAPGADAADSSRRRIDPVLLSFLKSSQAAENLMLSAAHLRTPGWNPPRPSWREANAMRATILGSWLLANLVGAAPEPVGAQKAAIVLTYDDEDDRDFDERRRGLDDGYFRRGDPHGRGGYHEGNHWGEYSPVGRAIRDLEFMASRSYTDHHEYNHFRRAIRELYRFDDRWRRGRFDKGRLDEAIENINHLAHADQIHPRDRARLRGHLYELRPFRSERGRYGY